MIVGYTMHCEFYCNLSKIMHLSQIVHLCHPALVGHTSDDCSKPNQNCNKLKTCISRQNLRKYVIFYELMIIILGHGLLICQDCCSQYSSTQCFYFPSSLALLFYIEMTFANPEADIVFVKMHITC